VSQEPGSKLLWAGLYPVLRSISIEFSIENTEPLRIGSGAEGAKPGSPVDLPVYRQQVVLPNGSVINMPVIPGSSLKGVLRTASMILAESCGIHGVHSGVGDDNCVHKYIDVRSFERLRKSGNIGLVRQIIAGFCPTCLLYGAPSVSSRVNVSDLVPVGSVSTSVKTGVGINRRTGAAHRGALYTVEFIEPGTRFQGLISAVNTPNWLLSLLAASLLLIGQGWLKIGGFKSRGMGAVKIVEDSVRLVIRHDATGKVLEALDEEIDQDEVLDTCQERSGGLVCSYDVLEKLSNLWHTRYCALARDKHVQRMNQVREYIKAMEASEGEAF